MSIALPLLRLTSTYDAFVSTVAADAALGESATTVPARSTVASRGLSEDARRPIESTVILLQGQKKACNWSALNRAQC